MSVYVVATLVILVGLATIPLAVALKRSDEAEQGERESVREWLGLDDGAQP